MKPVSHTLFSIRFLTSAPQPFLRLHLPLSANVSRCDPKAPPLDVEQLERRRRLAQLAKETDGQLLTFRLPPLGPLPPFCLRRPAQVSATKGGAQA